jgi:diguanylate cyclase (GGDEF)-like protein
MTSWTHSPPWPGRIAARAGHPARLAIVCAVYFGAAKAGLAFAFANQSVTSIWPPTGIALAAVLIWGYRMWPAIAVGAFLANITTAGPVLSVLAIATGNTLEAVVGAFLLSQVAGFRPSLERVRDVLSLVVFAGLLSTAISATVGAASLWSAGLVHDGQVLSTWRVWWLGDLGGVLVVAPALLILAARPALERRPRVRVEAFVLAFALVAVTTIAFSTRVSFTYLVIVIVLWIGLRFQQPGTAVAGLVASGIAIWATVHGSGPFVGGSEDAELLRAQLFVGVAMISGLVGSALSAERRSAVERLQLLADHDPLTGLLNRRRFTEELDRWIAYSQRYGGEGAVLVIDVDHFKSINDVFGHAVGDQVLADLAAVLRERVRGTDVVGRLGGDEFTVLLPRADVEQSFAVATAVLDRMHGDGSLAMTTRSIGVTASIGIGRFGTGLALDSKQVLLDADVAMYEAKDAGRDQVRVNPATRGHRREFG